jgi:hypothetical protein
VESIATIKLRGSAKPYGANINTLNDLKRHLDRFKDYSNEEDLKEKFLSLKQGHKQSLGEFATCIDKASSEYLNNIYGNQKDKSVIRYLEKTVDEEAKNVFLKGVHPEIRTLMKGRPANYEEAVHFCKEVEKEATSWREKKESFKNRKPPMEKGSAQRKKCSYCNMLGHTREECRKKKNYTQKEKEVELSCSHCNKKGHLVETCYFKNAQDGCFKCKSKDHKAKDCKGNKSGSHLQKGKVATQTTESQN